MKKLILIIFSLLILPTLAHSESLNLTHYYPSPTGSYDTLRLVPRDALLLPCDEGTLYTNKEDYNILYFCRDVDGDSNPDWTPLSVWAQNGDNIVLSDQTNPELKHVGIGTATPKFNLHLAEDGMIVSEGVHGAGPVLNVTDFSKDTRFLWYPRKSALRVGKDTGVSDWDDLNIGEYSISLGLDNRADGDYTAVSGGHLNQATNDYAVVSGGHGNIASALNTTVAGGDSNTASADAATVSGGAENTASGLNSVVAGGKYNTASFLYSTVSGGGGVDAANGNTAGGIYATVAGGRHNQAMANWSTVSGGWDNIVSDTAVQSVVSGGGANNIGIGVAASVIGGGNGNVLVGVEPVSRSYLTIGGGSNNSADYLGATIGGGVNNTVAANAGTISGGSGNVAAATDAINKGYTTIGGGENNTAGGDWSTVAGGGSNTTIGGYATVGGGSNNIAAGASSVIGGGDLNSSGGMYSVINGGRNNRTLMQYSVVSGGESNNANGEYSWAGGKNMDVTGDHSFAWGYDATTPVTVSADNVAVFFPDTTAASSPGNVGIGLTNPTATLHVDGNFKAVLVDFDPNPPTMVRYNTGTDEIGYDIAELFDTNEPVEIGDILVMDSTDHKKLKISDIPYDKRVAGVVSGAPAIVFEGRELEIAPSPREFIKDNKPPVALAGRVICKVSIENGPIEVGDLLTTSSTPGHAMKADDPVKSFGAVVGKAFEAFDGGPNGEETGIITIIVTLQ